ncbi:mechanosensitive ion channel domain-containing protein [Devosia sp.]|jgi:small conductance mechanosensitive channel|uniref:mechanosensitive ion channel family protein n=1 Tax=Devosia sp. TaxID=1871048 RepID=UPI001AD19EF7|nr:mechanosensitive ion channel domain-containing protein [Devosia sp.]MBN9332747.1 mechanosensitive ion channel [Devosia sp.]
MQEAEIFGISAAWVIANLWSLAIAILVLSVGWVISNLVSRYITGFLAGRLRQNATVAPLAGQVVRYGILFVTIIVVLGQFGVQTASILAVLGAAGLAIALALQGTLANIAAGIMLVFLRPFNSGDYIDADGIVGTVVEIGLFATQLRTIDGLYLFAPNSKLSNAKIINYSRENHRIVEVRFNVPRSADLDRIRAEVANAVSTEYSDTAAKPDVWLDTLGDSTMTLVARIPVRSGDWWQARSVVQERLKVVLERNNNFAPPAASSV